MKKVTQYLLAAFLFAFAFGLVVPTQVLDAKSYSSSKSSYSSSKSSSSGWGGSKSSSSKSSSGWGKSSSSSAKKSTNVWGSSTNKSTSKPKTTTTLSKTQSVTSSKTKVDSSKKTSAQSKSAPKYSSKKDAQAAFKKENATKYTSTYTSKPTTRPTHIPQSTSVGGRDYNVTYNVNHGGYGYTNSLGAWVVYDAMSDAIMMNHLMSRNAAYAYGAPVHHQPTRVVYRDSSSAGVICGTLLGLLCVLGVIVFICTRD